MVKVDQCLLDKLQEWRKGGDRLAEIKFDRADQVKVWIYDYSVQAGMFITDENVRDVWLTIILNKKLDGLLLDVQSTRDKLSNL